MHNEGSNLPTLRVTRDKRGYENTFIVDTGHRRPKGRTPILYWFRTPPGVRVGRGPLDPEAIRLIEAHHPDIEFDWQQILKGEEGAAPSSERERRDRNGRAAAEAGAPVTSGEAATHGRPATQDGPRRRRRRRRGGGGPDLAGPGSANLESAGIFDPEPDARPVQPTSAAAPGAGPPAPPDESPGE